MPGPNARYKKTEICRPCAKSKNVCQTCVFDLKYGLPVQVRDALLRAEDRVALPESDVNRAYALKQLESKMDAHGGALPQYEANNPILERLARRAPNYDRNRAHLCSFFARGACTRGDLCPYRHEMPQTTAPDLAKQNIKDRFHGTNDPLAARILSRASAPQRLTPPEDQSVTTLWLGGLPEEASEADVREHFAPFGDLSSVRLVAAKNCAFVTFFRRGAAEEAAVRLAGSLYICGRPIKIAWGKRQSTPNGAGGTAQAAAGAGSLGAGFAGVAGVAGAAGVPLPPGVGAGAGAGCAATEGMRPQAVYPSMQASYMPAAAAVPRPPGM
jgi:pre-mRNA-splicing factor RBM22/SLT11